MGFRLRDRESVGAEGAVDGTGPVVGGKVGDEQRARARGDEAGDPRQVADGEKAGHVGQGRTPARGYSPAETRSSVTGEVAELPDQGEGVFRGQSAGVDLAKLVEQGVGQRGEEAVLQGPAGLDLRDGAGPGVSGWHRPIFGRLLRLAVSRHSPPPDHEPKKSNTPNMGLFDVAILGNFEKLSANWGKAYYEGLSFGSSGDRACFDVNDLSWHA